ncbi:DUF802 domain-containing protein [Dyella choica]|uniref:DUF802 domain-containing protein n=1 Tax=Dyella choica TaxID=1927959 RepID=A0A3S0WY84_9GAMM|nr:DUF802 domain-containing protein [Dyella choica]RUL78944.1 DUF802 domain-containing protein [Dyella choica]
MLRNLAFYAVFLAGLAAVCWIGAGHVGSNPLGAAVAMLIGACYLVGGFELHRSRQATAMLEHAVSGLTVSPLSLNEWLDRLPPRLRTAVRLRVEGERSALPGPALTPYLVGLLVLLGMLGTLLGMMTTLRGTGLALESATDLQAIRGSLAAPIKGLGFAFGTSMAGVASSAMLGLLSALTRRERLHAVLRLDTKIATTLRVYSPAYQREETFKLLQQQTELLPALVHQWQAMMAAMERQSIAASERQLASQDSFHARTEAAYLRLASSVEQSLRQSAAESGHAVSAALQPAVEATMAGLVRETASLRDTVTHAVQLQLGQLSAGFEKTAATVAETWDEALTQHRQSNAALVQDLRMSQTQLTETFDRRSLDLLEGIATRLDLTVNHLSDGWNNALSQQQTVHADLTTRHEHALASAAVTFKEHATSLVQVVHQSHTDLQSTLESRDQLRLTAWTETFSTMTTALSQRWEQQDEHSAQRQVAVCDSLAQTMRDVSAQMQAHTGDTISEVFRLVQAASEAPKVAADVIAELRRSLSDSMARDNAMLEERNRLLGTLETLLDAVNLASKEQRSAVDALVTTSADLLDRASTRFTGQIEAEVGKLETVAAQIAGGAVEVASLGEAFGTAVQLFGQSNQALMDQLQHIADALDQSLSRSDEQLAYYVAQAKEVIDLSMLSQKQIIEDLQRMARQPASAGVESA